MNANRTLVVPATLALALGCSEPTEASPGSDAGADAPVADVNVPDQGLPSGSGRVTYHYQGHAYRVVDQDNATPEDISAALDPLAMGAGEDGAANLSPDGAWLVFSSERFLAECQGWACLVRAPADLSAVDPIVAAGSAVHAEGMAAIASGGDTVVFAGTDGPHDSDIFAVRRSGSSWSAPEALTAGSSHAFNSVPALSADGAHVLFDCGPQSFGKSGICEIGTDGSGFREVLMPSHVPPGMPAAAQALHHADYAPDGSIVFEGDWDGERIWRLPAGATDPVIVSNTYTNDNTPCVLPDGRIASLWLNRPENTDGFHELKLMSPDGTAFAMRVADKEIDDWGLGCGD